MRRQESLRSRAAKGCRRSWVSLRGQFLKDSVSLSLLILLLSTVAVFSVYQNWPGIRADFWSGVFIEFTGMLFDVVVFGVLISLYARVIERRRDIKRQQEIIDDYKKWDSEEARYRIAGSTKRLILLGKTDIDFGGIVLRNFSFRGLGIKTLRGSTFYDGTWGEGGPRDEVASKMWISPE